MKISISDKVTGSVNTVFITEMLDSNRGCENKNFFFFSQFEDPLVKSPYLLFLHSGGLFNNSIQLNEVKDTEK